MRSIKNRKDAVNHKLWKNTFWDHFFEFYKKRNCIKCRGHASTKEPQISSGRAVGRSGYRSGHEHGCGAGAQCAWGKYGCWEPHVWAQGTGHACFVSAWLCSEGNVRMLVDVGSGVDAERCKHEAYAWVIQGELGILWVRV